MKKGQGCREFEEGHPLTVGPAHLTDAPAEVLLGDHGPVDPDTLPEIDQVGRRVEPDPVACRMENGCQGCRDGALAVRPSHEEASISSLGVPQPAEQHPDGPETRPDAGILEAVEVCDGIKVHGFPGSRAMNLSALQGMSLMMLPCTLDPVP